MTPVGRARACPNMGYGHPPRHRVVRAVPRFYFHIVNDNFASDDKHGFDLPSVEAAVLQARRTIGAIIADELGQGSNHIPVSVRIKNEDGEVVADLTVHTRLVAAESPFVG